MANTVQEKTVQELIQETPNLYVIPNYQRGYRWTEREVGKLLDDVWEAQAQEKEKYYLQPMVVKKVNRENGEAWEVIDGQQRLTTIFLLLHYLKSKKEDTIFSLRYDSRNDTNNKIKAWVEDTKKYLKNQWDDETLDFPKIEFDCEKDDLDVYYMQQAVQTIDEWLKNKNKGDFHKYLRGNVVVLWYDMTNASTTDSSSTIELFSRINMGKIPLTAAELLKAMILRLDEKGIAEEQKGIDEKDDDRKDKKEQIRDKYKKIQHQRASEWDSIEKSLAEEGFFRFVFAEEKENGPRIDYLFQLDYLIETKKPLPSKDTLFDFYENAIKDNSKTAGKIWERITKIHRRLREWYDDTETFHKLGFLVACAKRSVETVAKVFQAYENKDSKSAFQGELDKLIKEAVEYSLTRGKGKNKELIHIEKLRYTETHDYYTIQKLLLLFNVVSAIQSPKYRFAFEEVYPLKEKATLEHIFPQNPNIADITKQDEVIPEFCKMVEAEMTKAGKGYAKLSDEPSQEELDLWWQNVKNALVGEDAEVQGIGNLALLSRGVNASVSNGMFSQKQQGIRKADSKGEYLPIATHNVFLKYYSIGESASATTLELWTGEDMEKYKTCMIDTIKEYLPKGTYEVKA